MTEPSASYCSSNPDDPRCLHLWKSTAATDSDRIIEGLASLDVRDSEGEIVHPDKLDFSYLDKGKAKINWNHRSDPGDQVGIIEDYKIGRVRDIVPRHHWCRVSQHLDRIGVWIRAKLKRGLKKAEDVWTDITSNPYDHGLGFSLQGTANRRGTDVIGGMVTNVALTPNPVLAETFAVLAKALATSYARQDQTGVAAATREDLRDQVISTTVGNSKYGRIPRGGVAFMTDAVVGHRRTRDQGRNLVLEPVVRSCAMPAGEPVQPFIDRPAAMHALREFLKYVRGLGPVRGNVLDGSENYFQMMHGLDHNTARALAKLVRENADKLFRKSFPGCLADYLEDEEGADAGFDEPSRVEPLQQPNPEPTSTRLSKDLQQLSDFIDRSNREAEIEQQLERTQRKRRLIVKTYLPQGAETMGHQRNAVDELDAWCEQQEQSSELNKGLSEAEGEQEHEEDEGTNVPKVHCEKCFAKMIPTVKFCPMCGTPYAPGRRPPTEEETDRWYAAIQSPDDLKRPDSMLQRAVRKGDMSISEALELIDHVVGENTYQGMLLRGKVPPRITHAVRTGLLSQEDAVKLILSGKADGPKNRAGFTW